MSAGLPFYCAMTGYNTGLLSKCVQRTRRL